MTDLRKAAEMALKYFEDAHGLEDTEVAIKESLRQALAEPEQEPVLAGSLSVRYFRGDKAMTDTDFEYLGDLSEGDYTLYTAPPSIEAAVLAEREACAEKTGEFARKWWSIHCASNKHMETTRKAHDDFCALQAAIRARGKK